MRMRRRVKPFKSQITDIQKQKREDLEELGNIVYTMFLKSAFDEQRVRNKSAAIATLDDQIKQQEKELAQIHAKAQEALGKPKAIAICSCGAEIYEGTKFCGRCGKRVEGNLA
jgi:flagellar biosynthesis chaperone FliJ